jgi:hypothetical protein
MSIKEPPTLGITEVRGESPTVTARIELGENDDRRTSPERRIGSTDRRKSARRRTLKKARTYWPNGDSVECSVRNLSAMGALLEGRSPIPNTFDLVIDGDQHRISCSVIWRDGNRAGVRFAEPEGRLGLAEGAVSRALEYRQYAEVCRDLARSPKAKSQKLLLKMAVTWEALAQQTVESADKP